MVPFPAQSMGGGGGSGVSIPKGASEGTAARYGYLWMRISLTGFVKSKKASSIDAFSMRPNHQGVDIGEMGQDTNQLHSQELAP